MKRLDVLLTLLVLSATLMPAADLVAVVAKPISRTVDLPGELEPFLSVSLHAKIRGYVEKVLVDRGSNVKKGQLLATLSAPEMKAQLAEAESKVQSAESDRLQAEAQLAAAQSTAARLKKAAETPGAVAGNELILAEKQVDVAKALVESRKQLVSAAEAGVVSEKDLASYLRITAPFDGVVTERLVHPGALVGPAADPVMLVIQQVSHLRLVVAVPEENVGVIVAGTPVTFHVPAYPDRNFTGSIARAARSLEEKNRTMPVELDVLNRDAALAPGMYTSVKWPIRRAKPGLFVPKTAVVTTTERTFVVRKSSAGKAEWINVSKGAADGDLIEIIGTVQAGDQVVRRATDEIRESSAL